MMQVGDNVRLLHGTEEGKIVRFIDDKFLEMEMSDGFIIPVLIREVVPVDKQEYDRFGSGKTKEPLPESISKSGKTVENADDEEAIFIGLTEESEGQYRLFMVNSSQHQVLYSISYNENNQIKGISAGHLIPGKVQLAGEFKTSEIKRMQKIRVRTLLHSKIFTGLDNPFYTIIDLLNPSKKEYSNNLPVLNKPGRRFDILDRSGGIDPEKLKESMMEPHKAPEPKEQLRSINKEKVVDLHIEKLTERPELLDSQEKLSLQLEKFEKEMDRALQDNIKTIKFIHGVGNGTLRQLIHKKLSQFEHLEYYKDADKERFGYGATIIELK